MTYKRQLLPTKIGCHAFIAAGKAEQYLKQLKHISAATINDEDVLFSSGVLRRGFLGIFEKTRKKLSECR